MTRIKQKNMISLITSKNYLKLSIFELEDHAYLTSFALFRSNVKAKIKANFWENQIKHNLKIYYFQGYQKQIFSYHPTFKKTSSKIKIITPPPTSLIRANVNSNPPENLGLRRNQQIEGEFQPDKLQF